MKHYIKGAFLTLAAAGMLSLGSCADKLDLENPDALSGNGFWKTQTQFEGNFYALMNQWRDNYDQNVLFGAGEFRSGIYSPQGMGTDGSSFNSIPIANNQLSLTQSQFSKFANFYGMIANCNTFIYYAQPEQNGGCMTDDCRNYLLGMAHGMRAWCYFQIHKMYGSGPMRIEPDVMLGNYDEISLQKETADINEFVAQIKDDLKKSEDYFNAGAAYKNSEFKANNGVYYWSPAATQVLAGEVYLWTGKVSTKVLNSSFTAIPGDVAIAEQHFNKVLTYGYQMMPTYDAAINEKVGNTEVIFATSYSLAEATTNWFNYITYDVVTGNSPGQYWQALAADGTTWCKDASLLSYYYDPLTGTNERNTFFYKKISGQSRYAFNNTVFYQFNQRDSRIYNFLPLYILKPEQRGEDGSPAINHVADFNPEDYNLASCYFWKYHGSQGYGDRFEGTNDMVYYRLPLIYLSLAECANYAGRDADVKKYIDMVRQRAYGANWNATTDAYTPGDFCQNETAILQEKMKEFLQEGQHWWDERRMTTVKGGTDKDHMIFQPQGNCGYGLDLAAHPNWNEMSSGYGTPNTGNFDERGLVPIDNTTPVLDYATKSYMVLWPLDTQLLTSDAKVSQNPGYDDPRANQAE